MGINIPGKCNVCHKIVGKINLYVADYIRGQSIKKKPNIWNSQTASARSTLAMVALYSGDFKIYSDTSSITPPQLVIEWHALDWVCV